MWHDRPEPQLPQLCCFWSFSKPQRTRSYHKQRAEVKPSKKKKKCPLQQLSVPLMQYFVMFLFFLSSPVSSELSGLCYCSVLPQLYQVISIRLMHLSIKFLLLVAGIGRATCCSIYGELHWSTFMQVETPPSKRSLGKYLCQRIQPWYYKTGIKVFSASRQAIPATIAMSGGYC